MKFLKKELDRESLADIESQMLQIQGAAKNIQNKHIVDEATNPLIGVQVNLENNETTYQISNELKERLSKVEDANLYILTQEDLNNNGLKQITVNDTEFYVVDYNSGEVFYSLGIDGKYALGDLEGEDKKSEEENEVEESEPQLVNEEEKEGNVNEGTGD